MREDVLEEYVRRVLLPPKSVAGWRAPAPGTVFPQPESDEVVSFLTFHEHGLGYPPHPLLLGLLRRWGLELQHLNPTGMLHIAGFVVLCEAFLGAEPDIDYFA